MAPTMLENAKSWWVTIRLKRAFLATGIGTLVIATSVLTTPPSGIASAQTVDPFAGIVELETLVLSEEEQDALLTQLETYFDSVETMQARFAQYNSDGSLYRGDIAISRPGKMRIEYDDPVPYEIISDGLFYIFIDHEMEETAHIPLNLTPADILLRRPMDLRSDVMIVEAARRDDSLYVTMVQTDEPDAGQITLAFLEEPFRLRQWSVLDAQGVLTRVVLVNPETGVEFNWRKFHYTDPFRESVDR